jgi:hypothetical protein
MGMRKKPVQKPMIGTVNKPKPATPAPQESYKAGGLGESIADQVSSGKLDKSKLPMLPPPDPFRKLPGGGLVPSPGSSGSSESNPSFARLRDAINKPAQPMNEAVERENQIQQSLIDQGVNPNTPVSQNYAKPAPDSAPTPRPVRGRFDPSQPNPPQANTSLEGIDPLKLALLGLKKQPIPQPNPMEDAIKAQLGDRYADYQKARSELNSGVQTMDLRQDPITGQMTSSTNIGNRERLFKQFGIDTSALPKPAPAPAPSNRLLPGGGLVPNEPLPARTISPLQQLEQNKQKMYQNQPASQQMQAPEAEPMQPASQQMQSEQPEQQAPAQDNSAIDAQIAQLQQQIAQLQAQKK